MDDVNKMKGFTEIHLTIEGEVSKDGSQQVHNKHGHNGDISNFLHAFLVWPGVRDQTDLQKNQLGIKSICGVSLW